jgi:hypothetical protein
VNIATQRLHTQYLLGPRLQRPEDVVRWLTAVQSQDYPGAKWGVAQRTDGSTAVHIDRAFNEGAILRTHVMRPTWHFVMPEDIRWMLELTAPRIKALLATYDRRLELDEALYARSNAAIEKALHGGKHLTRTELAHALRDEGIEATGQRLAHIVSRAELDAIICSGALRGKQHTYALLAERAPNTSHLDRDEALAELARRYFTSHGPALVQDFAWWSGLTVADAKTGLEIVTRHLTSEYAEGKTYWFAPPQPHIRADGPFAHLLPNYDEYLIAYRDRSAFFDQSSLGDATFFRDVLRRHIIVIDGQVVGGWHSTESRGEATIHLRLLARLTKTQHPAIKAAAGDYGRFLGKPVTLA